MAVNSIFWFVLYLSFTPFPRIFPLLVYDQGKNYSTRRPRSARGKPTTISILLKGLPTYGRRECQHELNLSSRRPHRGKTPGPVYCTAMEYPSLYSTYSTYCLSFFVIRGKAKEDRKCGASQCPFQTYSKKTVCLKPGCQWTNPSCLRYV